MLNKKDGVLLWCLRARSLWEESDVHPSGTTTRKKDSARSILPLSQKWPFLSFKVHCLIWTLLNVEFSMFPFFYAVHKTFNLICRTLSLPCIPINCHQISFCACFKVPLSLRLRTCKGRVIPRHIGMSFLPPFSSGFDYTCSNNCSFESI